MLLVDLNYNFEFDWFIELSDNKLSDNNLASELVGNRSFFKPTTIEEIAIFMIRIIKVIMLICLILLLGCHIWQSSLNMRRISPFFFPSVGKWKSCAIGSFLSLPW